MAKRQGRKSISFCPFFDQAAESPKAINLLLLASYWGIPLHALAKAERIAEQFEELT
jgi:hypothetical protein